MHRSSSRLIPTPSWWRSNTIDKKLARTNVTLEQWNKHFHDHEEKSRPGGC